MHKKENFQGSLKLPQAHEKVCNENERNKQDKNDARKNVKPFIRRIRRTGEDDLNELQVIDTTKVLFV